jgi:hypothetical protein
MQNNENEYYYACPYYINKKNPHCIRRKKKKMHLSCNWQEIFKGDNLDYILDNYFQMHFILQDSIL